MIYFSMINLSADKQLGIILPNTNRALGVVLKEVTPSEMQTLLKEKDLKSIVNSFFKQSAQGSDETLLNLVKNNPTLKDLGNISGSVKELLNALKSEKTALPIETTLQKFLLNMKELNEPILKQKLENSGVFLESKLKNVQNPHLELKNLLLSLEKSIAKSDILGARTLTQNIKDLLGTQLLKEASNSALIQAPKDEKTALAQLAKGVENIVSKLSEQLRSADITSTKSFEKQLGKLEHLLSSKMISSDNFKPALLLDALQNLSAQMQQSTKPEVKGLLDAFFKIVESLKAVDQNTHLDKKIPQELRGAVDTLKAAVEKSNPAPLKEMAAISSKLAIFSNPQKLEVHEGVREILSQDLKSTLLKAGDEIAKASYPNQAEILRHVDKLLLQIDYFQLLSHLSNSSSIYLPFSWDSLEDGNINIKKEKNSKFYCDIELKLKEHGELKIKLALFEENQINIHIYSQSSEFRKMIKESIGSLRSALIESHITPREIRIFDALKRVSAYEKAENQIDMGFEVKV